ncbi:MAG: FmdB family zinc ribbon protein [Armatimonadota bacterium]
MPLFEYRCSGCGKKFTHLVGMTADSTDPKCPKCGCAEATKLISRFSRLRSEDEKLGALEESALSSNLEDPRSASRFMREMGRELAEDGEEDFDEFVEEAEREIYDGESGEGE